MPRASVILQGISALLIVLSFSSVTFAAEAPRHVFYLTVGNTITTYNVNPTTLIPTQVGTPLTINGALAVGQITTTPNDQFIYVQWPDANYNYSLSVYATDSSGVPQATPVQTFPAPAWQFMMHPSGKFAYVLQTTSGSEGYSSTLYLYHIDQTTGALTQDPKIQATYGPDYYYEESLVSFNKAGTRLYDDWSVNFDQENNYNYSLHPVNTTTGQLAPDIGTIFAPSDFSGLDQQYFTEKLILNLHNDGGSTGPSVLNVYPLVKNPQQPLFVCTQSMLNACGTANQYWISIDQQYVFLPDTSDTVIGHIDTTSKQIVQTGTIASTPTLYFSPEDRLIYAVDGFGPVAQVYLFNPSNGTVLAGGSITFNGSSGYGLFPAVRQ